MSTLWLFLAASVGPLALRVIAALGFGLIAYAGVSEAASAFYTYATNAFIGMPSDLYAILSIAGVPRGVNLVVSAGMARVGMWVAASSVRWVPGVGS